MCIKNIVLAVGIISLTGCSTIKETYQPTENGLRERAANYLGYQPNQIQVSNIKTTGNNTYFLAKSPKGRYACNVPTGSMAAFGSFMSGGSEMENPNTCTKQP